MSKTLSNDSSADIEDEVTKVENILKLDPEQRMKKDLTRLTDYFQNNKFFREQSQNFEKATIQFMYRNMHFLELQKGQEVFKYGDVGELFYIVMDGEISIKTPFPEELEAE